MVRKSQWTTAGRLRSGAGDDSGARKRSRCCVGKILLKERAFGCENVCLHHKRREVLQVKFSMAKNLQTAQPEH